MATTVIKTIFQFRRATSAEWESVNPTLRAGEPAYVTDLKKHKIGDGITPWNDLPFADGNGLIVGDNKSIVINDGTAKMCGFDAAKAGAQPRKNADGELEWVVPSTDSLEGVQIVVDDLKAEVTSLKTKVEQGDKIEAVNLGDEELEIVEKTVTIPVGAGLDASDEVTIGTDGKLGIGQIDISKIIQGGTSELILDGGGAN